MNFKNVNVTVMGLGRFGGGLGVTKWLLEQGANVLVTDLSLEVELSQQVGLLGSHPNLKMVFGEHRIEDFTSAEVVIANPAIPQPWNNEFLKAAWDAEVTVTTEIALVLQRIDPKNVIAVTGTSGKSTTVSMIYEALQHCSIPSHLGGNIGGSLLDSLATIQNNDIVVLEVSSAMLWWLERSGGWSPHIAILTTIEENHIDWHGSFEEYKRCKQTIFLNQAEDDIALTQDPNATFAGLRVLGEHNERNAAVAFLAAVAIGADVKLAREGIQQFDGLPHRLQRIKDGVYNDSKSTTPLATKLAIDSFPDSSKVHVIVGGFDKKVELELLARQSERVGGMYAIGDTANMIVKLANGKVHNCETIEKAIQTACERMENDDVLLLSPGCASWDQFENYEQRGNTFCTLIR